MSDSSDPLAWVARAVEFLSGCRVQKMARTPPQEGFTQNMKITYDSEVDALYICFPNKPPEVTTHRLTEEVAINYAPNGQIAGIEVLDASEYVFTPSGKSGAGRLARRFRVKACVGMLNVEGTVK